MADKSQKAADAVEKLFKRKPDADLDEFMEVAAKADSSIDPGMDKRSFNAIYVLPLKRKASSGKSKSKKKSGSKKKKSGSKKKSKKRTSRRKTRKRGVSAAGRSAARSLILERDQQVIDTLGPGADPREAYELAAEIDDYIDRLHKALKS